MRVCVCATQIPFASGGAEALAEGLHHELRSRGFDSVLVSVPFAWRPRVEILKSALAWRMLTLDGPSGPPDLVIGTRYPSYLVRHPNKVVWLVHQFRQVYELKGTPFSDFGNDPRDRRLTEAIRGMDDRAFHEARRVFAISRNVARRLERHNSLAARVLYPPPRLAGRLRPAPPGDYVFTAGRLEELKRVEILVESLHLTRTPVRCKIAGEGPCRNELLTRIQERGLGDRIELLGRVSDEELVRLYRESLAVFYAPFDEDFGYVTLEAFLAGKAVITAHDSGAVLELVEDEVNGYVHDADRPADFARSLDRLWRDRERAATLGARGRSTAQAIGWDSVIENLTGRRAPGRPG